MTLLEKTLQSIGEARASVGVNEDDLQAGYNDTALSIHAAGGFLSYPPTASKGTSKWFASDNTGNFNITHTNVPYGQSTAFLSADPANANAVHMIAAGTAPFVSGNIPIASGTGGLFIDSGVAPATLPLVATINGITAAQIIAAYATPLLLLAAPASGLVNIIDGVEYNWIYGSAVFANGGLLTLQYGSTQHAGGIVVTAGISAAEVIAVTANSFSHDIPIVVSGLTSAVAATGIYISNASGAFTSGTGTTVNIKIKYHQATIS